MTGKSVRRARKVESDRDWLMAMMDCLRRRSIAEGIKLLDRAEPAWKSLELNDRHGAEVLLMLAQWVDVGYREPQLLRERLDRLTAAQREQMGVAAYVRVRMTEAFYALSTNDADGAIRILGGLLQMEDVFRDAELKALANLWKARAHRKKADYDMARDHLLAALEIAHAMPGSEALVAIIKIQQAWIVFQNGDSAGALQMLNEAETGVEEDGPLDCAGEYRERAGKDCAPAWRLCAGGDAL